MTPRPGRVPPATARSNEYRMKIRNSLKSLKDRPGAQLVRRRGKVS
ncbi:hypothetical protein GS939_26270 [Rhodococcus hoagii]|nr:hypothetical protein [Prescottella equi]